MAASFREVSMPENLVAFTPRPRVPAPAVRPGSARGPARLTRSGADADPSRGVTQAHEHRGMASPVSHAGLSDESILMGGVLFLLTLAVLLAAVYYTNWSAL